MRHGLRSVTKSFLNTAIGVLVQKGKLESVDRTKWIGYERENEL